jgi:tyrosinase
MKQWIRHQSRFLKGNSSAIPGREVERNLSERVAYILTAYQRFGPMCYNRFPGFGRGEAGKAEIWGSLEDIHNAVHGLVGNAGHMGQVPKSAYDPIFWLHHT